MKLSANKKNVLLVLCSMSSLALSSGESMFFPWPMPSSYSNGTSSVALANSFEFVLGDIATTSSILQQAVERYDTLIGVSSSAATSSGLNACSIEVDDVADNEISSLTLYVDESYVLSADISSCSIYAPTVWGAMHAMETFTQSLLRVPNDDDSGSVPTLFNLPLQVSDEPRFTHRGMLSYCVRKHREK